MSEGASLVSDEGGDVYENPGNLEVDEERRILAKGIETLEKITGKRSPGYCSPSWDLGKHSIQLLQEYGFLYDRVVNVVSNGVHAD